MTFTPTVFVVDDDPSVRDSVAGLLELRGISVETFASALEFIERYQPARAGCLVLDVRMPGMDGLELQQYLAEHQITIPVIILTGHADVPMTIAAMKAGAIEFLQKPYRKEDLLACVTHALERDAQTRRAQDEHAESRRRIESLTPREREVMRHLVEGKTASAIAAILGTTYDTVKHQRASILRKMQADSVVHLTRIVTAIEDANF